LDLDVCVDRVLLFWEIRAQKTGFPGVSEIDREAFVTEMLISMPFSRNLRVQSRYTIFDEEFGGPLDVVVYADTPSKLPVVYVVEAKKFDIDQGRAQLYPQSKVCHELAIKEENWNHPIFGVITTADLWIFVRYDGKKWIESKPCFIDSAFDRNGVQKVVESLYPILMHQDTLVQDLVAKYDQNDECE
jgi:hypothetical protein